MRILLFFMTLFFSLNLFGQTIETNALRGEITSRSVVSGSTYLITATVQDFSGQADGVAVTGDSSWVIWQDCKRYVISNIGCGSCYTLSGEIKVEVADVHSNGLPNTGFVTVNQENEYGISAFTAYTDDPLFQCIAHYYNERMKTILSGLPFDSNRNILRVLTPGVNIGGFSVQDWLEWHYFTPPTISLNSVTSVYEVGTSNSITLSGVTTNPGSATLSNGILQMIYPSSSTINTFGSSTSYSQGITFTPQQGGSGQYNEFEYRFRTQQDWSGAGESGTATSPTRIVYGVYPVLYGASATDLSSGGNPYTTLNKLVQQEGDKSVVLNASNEYLYFAMPKTWSDFVLSEIVDNSGFGSIGGWTAYDISITSSGIPNIWTQDYKLYKLNTLTSGSGLNYTFQQ